MARFKLETETTPGKLVVRLSGDFDLLAFDEVDGVLSAAQESKDLDVIVDLRSLEFIDSTGIRALMRAHARAAGGGRLRLIRGPETIQRVFELVGLESKLSFVETGDP